MFEIPDYIIRYKGASCSNCVNRVKVAFPNPSNSSPEWECSLFCEEVSLEDCCRHHCPVKEVADHV